MLNVKHGTVAGALITGILLAPTASAAPGDAIVNWAKVVLTGNATNPETLLGEPDNALTTVFPQRGAWLRKFEEKVTYLGLAKFLGVSASDLRRADIIAFEFNGGGPASGGGWESSTWFITDNKRAYAETFDETTGLGTITSGRRARFKTGDMLQSAYAAYFGIPVLPGPPQHVSWILINVPSDIDVHDPDFKVWLSAAKIYPDLPPLGDEGSPDPEAVGILSPF
jgi:hypothetical protein